jgi:hypothetical protein
MLNVSRRAPVNRTLPQKQRAGEHRLPRCHSYDNTLERKAQHQVDAAVVRGSTASAARSEASARESDRLAEPQ